MIGDSIGDSVSGIFGSIGSSAGFKNGEEDGISAYALVERREDIRCCWLEISLPTPITQNRASMIFRSCQCTRFFSTQQKWQEQR